jgi:hypothetical protein
VLLVMQWRDDRFGRAKYVDLKNIHLPSITRELIRPLLKSWRGRWSERALRRHG